MKLSRLIGQGAPHSSVTFGVGGTAVPVERLVEAGASHFSPHAHGDQVGLLMTNDQATVEILLGALAVGARLVSVPLPGRGADVAEYVAFLKDACAVHQLHELVMADEYAAMLDGAGVPLRRHRDLGSRPLAAPAGAGFSLVQFTSGSTGMPRPVAVDDTRLGANVAAILQVLRPRPGDALVSWLPLSHDMGLVGMLLTGLAAGAPCWTNGAPIVLLDPVTFLRSPSSWVEALSHHRGSFTASPDFGLRLALRRRPASHLDLSSLRCMIVGGEMIRAATLDDVTASLAAAGLRRQALCPAYGMAEVGLAVSITAPEEDWRDRAVSIAALASGDVLGPRGRGDQIRLVACGRPLPGYSVVCPTVDEGVGPLGIAGPSLGADPLSGADLGDEGVYRPGDVGFVDDGRLFVCGRDDDVIVGHGCNVYAPAVESAIAGVDGIRPGRVTAVGLPTGEWAVVAEPTSPAQRSGPETARLARAVRHAAVQVSAMRPDRVVFVDRGQLPLTASGKIQRNLVRRRLVDGAFE